MFKPKTIEGYDSAHKIILTNLEAGMTLSAACASAGVPYSTFQAWRKHELHILESESEDPMTFGEACELAMAKARSRVQQMVFEDALGEDPKNRQWWLTHRDKDFRDKQEVEVKAEVKSIHDDALIDKILHDAYLREQNRLLESNPTQVLDAVSDEAV